MKKTNRKGNVLNIILVVLIALIIIILGVIGVKAFNYYYEPTYESVTVTNSDIPSGPVVIKTEEETRVALTELEQKNAAYDAEFVEDRVGWIAIPDIGIDNVVVQGDDNDYYLTHDEFKEYEPWGSFFVNSVNDVSDPYNLDRMTSIFGHANGYATSPKFASLRHFTNPEYAQTVKTIDVWFGETKTTWQIFMVGNYPIEHDYLVPNPTDEILQDHIDRMKANSYNQYEVDVTTEDKILILSTCTSESSDTERFLVASKLISIG